MYSVILAVKILSKSLPKMGNKEIGLYDEGEEAGLLGLRIIEISEIHLQNIQSYER